MIAALFVETHGCYFNLPGVDPWDIKRDARLYAGPYPVVAHPPCQRWGRFSKGSPTKQIWETGDDGGCFESALKSVRAFGGVLEHPADTKAFKAFGIPKPLSSGWLEISKDEWVGRVDQGHYGFPSPKRTWLLVCGPRPAELVWGPSPQKLPEKRLATAGYELARKRGVIGNMSSKARQRTPTAFRNLLLGLAGEPVPAWYECPCCDNCLCNIHGCHAHDCGCPSLDFWDAIGIDPYTTGGEMHPNHIQERIAEMGWVEP